MHGIHDCTTDVFPCRKKMSNKFVSDGIARLEAISAEFNYSLAIQYVRLAKSYLKNALADSNRPPIRRAFASGEELPSEIALRLEQLFAKKVNYSPTTRNVCKWYLDEQYAFDRNVMVYQPSFYESLIEMLEIGGDFYEHHGDLCIRDIAMIPYRNIKPGTAN